MYRIGYNQALDVLRKRRDIPQDPTTPETWATQTEASAETRALAHDLARALNEAIDALPGTLRDAFILRDIEDLSTREVAEVLSIGQSAVKMRLARARAQLRDALQDQLWN